MISSNVLFGNPAGSLISALLSVFCDRDKVLQATVFCSVLFFSRPRSEGLATPGTNFLYSSLSSVILSPIHVLMLSIQAVRGLPRLRAPGIVPCIISFSRQIPCFLMV